MKRQKLFAGLLTVLVLSLFGCGTAEVVPPAPQIDLSAIAVTDAGGAPCAEQMKLTVDDTMTLNAVLPAPEVAMTAVSSGTAVKVEVTGGQILLTAADEGAADITVTFSAEGLTSVQRVIHAEVELHSQELTVELVPLPETFDNGEAPADPAVKAAVPIEDEPEEPEPTCSYDSGVLNVQISTAAALDLVGEADTIFTLKTDNDCVDAAIQDGLLVVTGREVGTAVVTITGEKTKYKPALLELSVKVVLPSNQRRAYQAGTFPAEADG